MIRTTRRRTTYLEGLMKIALRSPRAVADDILTPLMQRGHLKSIIGATWDFFTTSVHFDRFHGYSPLVRFQPNCTSKEWGCVRLLCQAANRIAQVHKVSQCWHPTMMFDPPCPTMMYSSTGNMQRTTMGLLFHLVCRPALRLLPITEWVRLTSCCHQLRVMRPRGQYTETHYDMGMRFQVAQLSHQLCHLDRQRLEQQSDILATAAALHANGQLWPKVVGETLISYIIPDPGQRFLEVQDWVRLTACNTQAREMRCSVDHGNTGCPAAEELGFRLLTQSQNSRGVKLQRKVPGGPLVVARASSCHHTTHRAWSFYLPEFKLNKRGQTVRKHDLSPERQQSLRDLCVTATTQREASQSNSHTMDRAGSSESYHLECYYGSFSNSNHSAADQCPRHPPITFFGMNRHLVRPTMPCTCSVGME